MIEITEEQINKAARIHSIGLFTSTNAAADFETGFDEGAKWMQEQMRPEWISVKDRLPEELDNCIFVVDIPHDHRHGRVFGGVYTGDPLSKNQCRINEFSTPGIGFTASHWMPLPQPPTH